MRSINIELPRRRLLIASSLLFALAVGGAGVTGQTGNQASAPGPRSGGMARPLGAISSDPSGQLAQPIPSSAIPVSSRPGGAMSSKDVKHDVSPPLRSIPPAHVTGGQVGDTDELESRT